LLIEVSICDSALTDRDTSHDDNKSDIFSGEMYGVVMNDHPGIDDREFSPSPAESTKSLRNCGLASTNLSNIDHSTKNGKGDQVFNDYFTS
jgi:hypothetical protein